MNHHIWNGFRTQAIYSTADPYNRRIQRASASDILDFARQSCEIASTNLPRDVSLFSHSASLSLGCGRWPCSSIECRLEGAERLAHYAALYSDRVYIRNFFADYIEHLDSQVRPDQEKLRQVFAEDLQLLGYLKPVIEAGQSSPSLHQTTAFTA